MKKEKLKKEKPINENWELICPKCNTQFAYDEGEEPTQRALEAGMMCPVCKEKGYMLVGVIHPKRRIPSHEEDIAWLRKFREEQEKLALEKPRKKFSKEERKRRGTWLTYCKVQITYWTNELKKAEEENEQNSLRIENRIARSDVGDSSQG